MGKNKDTESKYDMQEVVDDVGKALTTAQRMREKINAVRGASYAKCFTAEDELLQVKSWIKLKEFFKLGTGCMGFPGGQITQIIGEPDSGKCHTKGTKVLMFDGTTKKVEDVVVGDKLMGPDSRARTVLALGRGEDELYDVVPNKGCDPFGVNKAHILSLVNSNYTKSGFVVDEVYNMSVAEYLTLPKTIQQSLRLYRVAVNFPEQEVAYDPYWVGLWLGDGSLGCTTITKDEPDLESYFEEFAAENSLIYRKRLNPDKCANYLFTQFADPAHGRNNPLLDFCRDELVRDGEKRIPQKYISNSVDNRMKLLAGLLDTDGYLDPKLQSYFEIATKYVGLRDDILLLARSLGFMANSTDKYVQLEGWDAPRLYFRIGISGACSRIPTRIKRKQARDSAINRSTDRTGFELRATGRGAYYGFTLDGDHLYLLADTTVTHNTTLMMEGMVSCQKAGGVVYLIDSEHKFSMARFVLMGGIAEDLVVIQVESLEAAWDAINDVCKAMTEERIAGNFFPAMLCWDSVAASVPDKILDEEEAGNAHVSVEAKINNKNVRKLHQAIKRSELACVFINHFYMTMPKGKFDQPKLKIKGGEELEFFSLLIIKTKKGAKIERTIKGETQKLGRCTKFEIVKGHFHGRTIEKEVYVVDKGILESKEELEEYKKTLRGDL